MFILDLFIAFFIAIILSVFLVAVFGWQRPGRTGFWPAMLFIFLIIFLASWAGGVWITPMGPALGGVYWLPFVFVAIIVALFLMALIPPRRTSTVKLEEESRSVEETEAVLGAFFWLFIIALVVAIIIRYVSW
ncbi:MAG: hypothetical protein GF315_07700 [candidate division Zixibacteria bacterium]|nr:hypothetical protein [candidate division Zixibacteria bacterium]